jgi:hypothetical protein
VLSLVFSTQRVLSKAVLFVADDKITGETIVRQLSRRAGPA